MSELRSEMASRKFPCGAGLSRIVVVHFVSQCELSSECIGELF